MVGLKNRPHYKRPLAPPSAGSIDINAKKWNELRSILITAMVTTENKDYKIALNIMNNLDIKYHNKH